MVATFEPLSERQPDETRQFMLTYWQRLVELGMPTSEARKVARAVARYRAVKQSQLAERLEKVRSLIPSYWRQLIELGVPVDDAKRLAEAIAEYDVLGRTPEPEVRDQMRQHCRFLCRAGLWRLQLVMIDFPERAHSFDPEFGWL